MEDKMEQWHPSCCMLCGLNCGLELLAEENKIINVKPMKDNPRSKGYICRKGMNIIDYQHHSSRLTHPLKKTEQGFEKISWGQAIREISEKLKAVTEQYGPKSFAYMGGGGQACHFEAFLGLQLMHSLGSKYHYSALGQELTGHFWVYGRALGKQNCWPVPDEANADMLIAIGWNAMESHQTPRAPLIMQEFSKNPEKCLVVIDPRKSKTARIADIHVPVRPGSDALLIRALIAMLVDKDLLNHQYIKKHVSGWERIKPWFENFDYRKAISVCEVDYDQAEHLCHLLATRKWCMHAEMGVLMNRHSTVTSYLLVILTAICGRLLVPGGVVIPGKMVPLGFHTDERDDNNWRTQTTDFPAIDGFYPPNVMPEEILSDHPERLRAVIACNSNPLRSYADTPAYETAFKKLDLLVCIDIVMSETAELSDYVLPARSGFEGWDGCFFALTHPEIYFQMRRPFIVPEGDTLEAGEIYTRIADNIGLIPDIPDTLYKAAEEDRLAYAMALSIYAYENPEALRRLPFIITKTLGPALGSAHLAMLWAITQQMVVNYKAPNGKLMESDDLFLHLAHDQDSLTLLPDLPKWLKRSRYSKIIMTILILSHIRPSDLVWDLNRQGFTLVQALKDTFAPKRVLKILKTVIARRSFLPLMQLSPYMALSERVFNEILENPRGLIIGKSNPDNFTSIRTSDKKVQLHMPELAEWLQSITADSEEKALALDPDFPLILNAGSHMPANANTQVRKPSFIGKTRGCTLLMNPRDADLLDLKDGEIVNIVTEAGRAQVEIEITKNARKGQVVMPHGFGLKYEGKVYGANVNLLTKNTHRDRWAATPYHRFVPCRVEKI